MKVLILGDVNSVHIRKWCIGLAGQGISIGIFSLAEVEFKWFDGIENIEICGHGAIKDRRHQAGLIQVQLRQNLGHLNANPEAAGTRCPLAILPESLKIDFRCLFAGTVTFPVAPYSYRSFEG